MLNLQTLEQYLTWLIKRSLFHNSFKHAEQWICHATNSPDTCLIPCASNEWRASFLKVLKARGQIEHWWVRGLPGITLIQPAGEWPVGLLATRLLANLITCFSKDSKRTLIDSNHWPKLKALQSENSGHKHSHFQSFMTSTLHPDLREAISSIVDVRTRVLSRQSVLRALHVKS